MELQPAALLAALAKHGTDPDPKRERVLDAALAAFIDFGVRRTSMSEIAKRSGVSMATLYRWYDGKDDLVAAVLLREARTFVAELETGIPDGTPLHEHFAEVAIRVFRRLRDTPLLDRLFAIEPERILPLLTTGATPLLQFGTAYLTMRLEAARAEGLYDGMDASVTAELLVRSIHSLLLTPTSALPLDDEDRSRELFSEILRRLLS
jgi:AcrR family transcriptional regulator